MMDGRFRMEGDHRCTRLGKIIKVDFRMLGHKMHIEGKCRMLSECFDDGASESQIRHEMTVHNVQMDKIGASLFDILQFGRKIGKISG